MSGLSIAGRVRGDEHARALSERHSDTVSAWWAASIGRSVVKASEHASRDVVL